MQLQQTVAVDPWRLEIIAIRRGSHTGAERRAVQRDHERGLLTRLWRGAYVECSAFGRLSPEGQHIVRMRALAAVSDRPLVFSHFSAAVAQDLPLLRDRLAKVHVTVDAPGGLGNGLAAHCFAIREAEVVQLRDLVVTTAARTVVDVAGLAPFEEGVMVADAALHAGVPRALLQLAIDLAGPR